MERDLVKLSNLELIKTNVPEKLISKSYISYALLTIAFNYDYLRDLTNLNEIVCSESILKLLCNSHGIRRLKPGRDSVEIYDYSRINKYLKEGYFIYSSKGECKIAICNLRYLSELMDLDCLSKVYLLNYKEFIWFFENNFSHLNTVKSKYYLDFHSKDLTAKNINFIKTIVGFGIIFFTILLNFPIIFHLLNNASYFAQNFLKIYLVVKTLMAKNEENINCRSLELPIYTILIPIYKEEKKINSIFRFIEDFNYPKFKLDVKIIVEEDDYSLLKKIKQYKLPDHIQIIVVPFSLPRTKPKALNYALQYTKGKYIVVYDAEDKPEPDQLIKAVQAFENLPTEYVCVQGKLNFYNKEENLLTKFFSIEYSLWFDYLLQGLSILNLPVTLGGTSNHFKSDILKSVGGWDAYNVTEDAELGIRLYVNGFKVHVMNSYTLEEAPITINAWLKQRARWIKGFVQTYFVFIKLKNKLSKLQLRQLISIYIFIGISTYSFCALPWVFIMVIKNSHSLTNYLWLINSFFAFSYIYACACHILLSSKNSIKNFKLLDYLGILLFPFYFLLHTVASYMAIWESLWYPFRWNKTTHGLSNIDVTDNSLAIKNNKVTTKKIT